MLRCCPLRSAGASSAPRRAPALATYRCRNLVARVACQSGPEARRQYRAEFNMLSNRLGGTVSNAIEAALHDRAAGPTSSPSPSPAELAAHLLRCIDKQLQARKYASGGDEAGDVLGSFPSNTLLYYQGEGLQGVLEHVGCAATHVRDRAAGPSAVALLRALAAAVGRLAVQPGAQAAQQKAAAVMTCLYGTAEALEGGIRRASRSKNKGSGSGSGAAGCPSSSEDQGGVGGAADTTAVALEAGELLREAAGLVDTIASGFSIMSPSTPAHPMLAALETRLYSSTTWRPASAADIASSLVDLVAELLAPSHVGNTMAHGSPAARTVASDALHSMARAQEALSATLRLHGAAPASASRLFAALAEALAARVVTRDAGEAVAGGGRPQRLFGEAQVLVGLSLMASGDGLQQGPGAQQQAAAAALAAEAAAGDASADPGVQVSDATLVLEVLAEEARRLAATHRAHIRQVLQDLRDVPRSLTALSGLPDESVSSSGSLSMSASLGSMDLGVLDPYDTSVNAAEAASWLLRLATDSRAELVATEAAAAIAAENEARQQQQGGGAGVAEGKARGGTEQQQHGAAGKL